MMLEVEIAQRCPPQPFPRGASGLRVGKTKKSDETFCDPSVHAAVVVKRHLNRLRKRRAELAITANAETT